MTIRPSRHGQRAWTATPRFPRRYDQVRWTGKAISDLARLYDFLAPVNRRAAAQIVKSITIAPTKLIEHPRLGERLQEFAPREVRRLLVGRYEMRYEVQGSVIHVLRVWHTREDRRVGLNHPNEPLAVENRSA